MRAKLSFLWWGAVLVGTAFGCAEGAGGDGGDDDGGSGATSVVGFGFRRPIEVTEGAPEGYAVFVDFNHAELVSNEQAQADGSDVRITFESAQGDTELDRIVDPVAGWDQPVTRLWFRTQSMMEAEGIYFLYYGKENAGVPPEEPANVFEYYDDFEDGELDASWTLSAIGGATNESVDEMGGVAKVGGATGDIGASSDSFVLLHREVSGNFVVDAEITDTSGSLGGASKMGGLMVRQSDADDSRNVMITIQQTPRQRVASQRETDGGTTTQTQFMGGDEFPQLVSLQRNGQSIGTRYSDNGLAWVGLGAGASIAFTDPVLLGFPFANISGGSGFAHMGWVRIRKLVLPEPQATVGEEEEL